MDIFTLMGVNILIGNKQKEAVDGTLKIIQDLNMPPKHALQNVSVGFFHLGVFGGTVHEAMADIVYMLNTLVDKHGKLVHLLTPFSSQ